MKRRKPIQMRMQSSLKHQTIMFGCLLLGYFSPLTGMIAAFMIYTKRWDKGYIKALFLGGVLAFLLYFLGFMLM